MNKEQLSGKFDQAVGRIKQKAGEASGRQDLANQGIADQIKGAAKETWGRVKDTAAEINKTVETKEEAAQRNAGTTGNDIRENIASATQNIKDRIGSKLDQISSEQRQEREKIDRS